MNIAAMLLVFSFAFVLAQPSPDDANTRATIAALMAQNARDRVTITNNQSLLKSDPANAVQLNEIIATMRHEIDANTRQIEGLSHEIRTGAAKNIAAGKQIHADSIAEGTYLFVAADGSRTIPNQIPCYDWAHRAQTKGLVTYAQQSADGNSVTIVANWKSLKLSNGAIHVRVDVPVH